MSAFIHGHRSRIRHGEFGGFSLTYNSWRAMKQRCDNPKNAKYQYYGGRGVTYDPRWKTFEVFEADMGSRIFGQTLGRYKHDLPYCEGNCFWQNSGENSGGRRKRK